MTTAYTSLLGLALPVTGELSGTWGDTVNNSITSLLDSAIAGTTTISSDADVTLSTTTGAANESREAILLWTAGGTVTRNITAPAQSKTYIVINKSSSTQSIVLRGVGPTTGVTIIKGEAAVCAWNGSDFIKVSNISGAGTFSSLTVTGTTTLSGLTASTALALDASKNVVSVTNTGTGNNVLATSPTITTPTISTITSAASTALTLQSAGTTAITVDTSQNVGIGVTPSAWLSTVKAIQLSNRASIYTDSSGNTIVGNNSFVNSSSQDIYLQTAQASAYLQGAGQHKWYNAPSGTAGNAITFTQAMTLDASGNLLVGQTTAAVETGSIVTAKNLEITRTVDSDGAALGQLSWVNNTNAGSGSGTSFAKDVACIKGLMDGTGNNSGGYLTFETKADAGTRAEQMRIDSSGNVLVGTTTSNNIKFVVDSGASNYSTAFIKNSGAIPNNNDNSALYVYHGGTTGTGLRVRSDTVLTGSNFAHFLVNNSSSSINGLQVSQYGTGWIANFDKSGTSAFFIDSSGNVGIGQTSITRAFTNYNQLNISGSSGATIQMQTGSTNNVNIVADGNALYLASLTGTMNFATGGTGTGTERMRIDTSGNVGIGTASPSGRLHVTAAAGSQTSVYFGNQTAGARTDIQIYSASNSDGFIWFARSGGSENGNIRYNHSSDYMSFQTNSAERMRINSSGNVGIGNTNPAALLHVGPLNGSGSLNGYTKMVIEAADYAVLTIKAPAANAGQILFTDTTSTNLGEIKYLNSSNTTPNAMTFGTNSTERMRIDSSGFVFVGCTTTPSASVSGVRIGNPSSGATITSCGATTTSVTHNIFTNGNGQVGSISTNGSLTSYNVSSDYRLKNTIAPMTGALEKIALLKPCTYKWNADGSDGQGFIAHELAKVVPGCVTGDKDAVDSDGNPVYQGIDTSFLVATLTAAIQELKAELDAYKSTHP